MNNHVEADILKKNMAYNAAGQVFYAGCQWLLTVFVLRLSGLGDSGLLTLCISVTNTFFPFAVMGLRTLQVSETETLHSDSTYVTMSLLAGGASWLFCAAYVGILNYTAQQRLCVLLFMGFKVSEAVVDCFHGVDQKHWRFDLIAFSLTLRGLIGTGAFVAGLVFLKNLPAAIVLMAIGCYGVILLFDIPKSRALQPVTLWLDGEEVRAIFRASKYVTIFSVLASTVILVPREILLQSHGAEVLGIYGALSAPTAMIAMVASFIFSPLLSVLAGYFAARDKAAFYKSVFKVIGFILLLGIAAEGAVFLLGHFVINLIFGPEVAAYTALLYPLVLCAVCIALTSFFSLALVVVRGLRFLLVSGFVGFFASLLLSRLWVPKGGMNGVNAALAAAELLILAIQVLGLLLTFRERE